MTYIVARLSLSDGWVILRDGVAIETTRGHYDVEEVLLLAEHAAGQPLAWKLTGDGFESVAVLEG